MCQKEEMKHYEEENHFRTVTVYPSQPCSVFCHKMAKLKDRRREKISVATEIDRLEERRARCQDNLERAEFRSRKEELSDKERQELEDEMAITNERVRKLDKELETLRGENRKNMVLSVAMLVISALFYYIFFYNEEDS
ncbi:coiled-coil domain-containing protein 167 [Siniperca chuatsi]|uniref:coiled-coil domain-containing protein 167 n=1 Tax=Siniperca chuatsi TaxID=119488 RepID=UPI001CE231C7|nr:coiled-coil domain-containing protein 167 [Siniperca chuatsi]